MHSDCNGYKCLELQKLCAVKLNSLQYSDKARFFLLLDLRDFFFRFRVQVGGGGGGGVLTQKKL